MIFLIHRVVTTPLIGSLNVRKIFLNVATIAILTHFIVDIGGAAKVRHVRPDAGLRCLGSTAVPVGRRIDLAESATSSSGNG